MIGTPLGTLRLCLLLGAQIQAGSYGFEITRKQELHKERWTHDDVPRLETATDLPPSGSQLGAYDSAAVASDGKPCSAIGADILKANGNAVEAAIATNICLGVVVQESMGLGGGFLFIYYNRSSQTSFVLDARESAPEKAYRDMYAGDAELSSVGGLSIAVPGASRGYWELYQRFGRNVSWSALLEPSVALCEEGFSVTPHMARSLASKREKILSEPTMSMYVNPSTGDVYREGDVVVRPDLAKTLRVLQQEPDALHTGSLSAGFLRDLKSVGSIITKADLDTYRPTWRTPVEVSLSTGGFTMHSVPPPGSGVILGFILNVLDNYGFSPASVDDENAVTTYQRITEAFKYAYARRTDLGDPDFEDMTQLIANLTSESYAREVASRITDDRTSQDPEYYGAVTYSPEPQGTSHLSVWGADGSVVAMTSTINLLFGALVASPSTRVVFNDEMDDFSSPNITNSFGLPPSPANFIKPGKRPLSSMCPAIFTDRRGEARLAIGAAGGSKITSATAWVALQNLWLGKDVKQAVDSRRLHHQLFPMTLQYEHDFSQDAIEALEAIGHVTSEIQMSDAADANGVARGDDGKVYANSDFRKGDAVDGF